MVDTDKKPTQIGFRVSGDLYLEVLAKQRELQEKVPDGILVDISTTIRHLIIEGLKAVREKQFSKENKEEPTIPSTF